MEVYRCGICGRIEAVVVVQQAEWQYPCMGLLYGSGKPARCTGSFAGYHYEVLPDAEAK